MLMLEFTKLSKAIFSISFSTFIKISIFTILLTSCSSKDEYLYDSPRFDVDSRSVVMPNPNAPMRVPPNYNPYYQPQAYQPRGYRNPSAYAPQQGYGSRYYSDPYAMPSPQYDGDQYYVPPSYYSNYDPYQGYVTNASNGDRNFY